jgi:hypothetical protein
MCHVKVKRERSKKVNEMNQELISCIRYRKVLTHDA